GGAARISAHEAERSPGVQNRAFHQGGMEGVYPDAIVASARMTSAERKPLTVIFRLLEHDERVFAVLLAVGMIVGLATLGLDPFTPPHQIDLYRLVVWFAAYKVGVFVLVTVNPRA